MKNVLLYMFLWLFFIPTTQTILQTDPLEQKAYDLQKAAYTSILAIQNFLKKGCDQRVIQYAVHLLKKNDNVFSKEQALGIAVLLATQWAEDIEALEHIASITIEKTFADTYWTNIAKLTQAVACVYEELFEQQLRFERNF